MKKSVSFKRALAEGKVDQTYQTWLNQTNGTYREYSYIVSKWIKGEINLIILVNQKTEKETEEKLMTLSQEQNELLGYCIFCNAKMYQTPEGVKSINPELDCLCKVKGIPSDLWNRVMKFQYTNKRKVNSVEELKLENLLYKAGAEFYISQLRKDLSRYPLFDAVAIAIDVLQEDFQMEEFARFIEISLGKQTS